jgi:predicted flap endonuclease-1-like 5' DNA nuclease
VTVERRFIVKEAYARRYQGPSEPAFPKGIAKPALRALASAGMTRLDQVARFTESQLLALHGMGPKALRIIKAALRAQGKSLAEEK